MRLLVIAAIAVLLAVTGCGGKSKDEVISEADELCREAERELEENVDPELAASPNRLPAYAAQMRPVVSDHVQDLKGLDPPDEDREHFDDFVSANEELLDLLEQVENTEARETTELRAKAAEIEEVADDGQEAAEDYGFEDCAD